MIAPNPRRLHPYQIHDSTYSLRACGARWAVVEHYTVLDRNLEKDDRDEEVAWFDNEEDARYHANVLIQRASNG